ncbi:ATP-binding protein [Streptomyces sp. NPDC006984]|uniref:ATP-binding protein n=1 Tax=Streptomyces sp. NPDC006984 TaxID=3155463 RepID=UPI0034081049
MRPPQLTMALLATPEALAGVRRALRAQAGPDCHELQLCAVELVTNVLRHVGEGVPVAVRVLHADGRVRLEVTDPDPRSLPVPSAAAGDAEGGRGLLLLDALALRWGVDTGPCDKTVWCELAADPEATWQGPAHALVLGGSVHRVEWRAAVPAGDPSAQPAGRARRMRSHNSSNPGVPTNTARSTASAPP